MLDLTGQRFGRLVVERRSERTGHWVCRCDCGTVKDVSTGNLRGGYIKSCNCIRREQLSAMRFKHGRGHEDYTYRSWVSMRSRCNNSHKKKFEYWGGRGITVCPEWDSFETFLRDMGERPEGKTIDRIDNDKGYCKENCRWATAKEQRANQRPRK